MVLFEWDFYSYVYLKITRCRVGCEEAVEEAGRVITELDDIPKDKYLMSALRIADLPETGYKDISEGTAFPHLHFKEMEISLFSSTEDHTNIDILNHQYANIHAGNVVRPSVADPVSFVLGFIAIPGFRKLPSRSEIATYSRNRSEDHITRIALQS